MFELKYEDMSEEEWAVLVKVVGVLYRNGGGKKENDNLRKYSVVK